MIKKGLIIILNIILVTAHMISPFNIVKAESTINNQNIIGAYNLFIDHGLTYNMSADITGKIKDNPSTYSISANDLRLTYSNSTGTEYNFNVYTITSPTLLGRFQGIEIGQGEVATVWIHYITLTGQKRSCTDCIITLDHQNLADNIYNPNAINFSHTVNFDDINAVIENKEFYSYVSGTYTNIGRYTGNSYIFPNYHFIFATPQNVYNSSAAAVNNSIVYYTSSGTHNFTSTTKRTSVGGFNVYDITFQGEGWVTFDITTLNGRNLEHVMPIWFGSRENMPDELYASLYGNINLSNNYLLNDISGRLATTNQLLTTNNQLLNVNNNYLDIIKDLINTGNNASQQTVNNADAENQNLNNSTNNLENIENQLNNNFSSNVSTVDTNLNVNNLSGFVYSANYVKNVFNRLTQYEGIQLLVTYSLIIGLSLLIIGRSLK